MGVAAAKFKLQNKRVQREDLHAAQQAQEQADIDAAIQASIDDQLLQESQVKRNASSASMQPQEQHAQQKLRHTAPEARNVEVSIGASHGENSKTPQIKIDTRCNSTTH